MARVVSLNIKQSPRRTSTDLHSIVLRRDHGIIGDLNAGRWHRQISLLGTDSIERASEYADPEQFISKENILAAGISVAALDEGMRLRVGTAVIEVTEVMSRNELINRECGHSAKALARHIIESECAFAIVIEDGVVNKGDEIQLLQ